MIRLTRNEKKTLKLLLENSRITDSEIASKLNISSQAVGKIRRKLESSVIDSYGVNLKFHKLGIHIFAVGIAKITPEGLNKGELEVEEFMLRNPHIINVYRIPKGSSTHILVFGFKNMVDLDEFFHSQKMKEELHNYLEIQELFTFSHNSLIKNSPVQLFKKIIDSDSTPNNDLFFNELENFKKRIN